MVYLKLICIKSQDGVAIIVFHQNIIEILKGD